MAVFSPQGRTHFVHALAEGLNLHPYTVTLRVIGGKRTEAFPVTAIVANDQDVANTERGTWVLTFKCVVPAGANVPGPCDTAEVWTGNTCVFQQPLNNFRPGPTHASVLYLNFVFGER